MNINVSSYQDADLLDNCLHSIHDTLDDPTITVTDGRYESWPAEPDNSTDNTRALCEEYNATYNPAGPFDRERDKHVYRVHQSPDGERVLFLDADERLLAVDQATLNDADKLAYQPRIYNALVYGPKSVYWPRCFYPETVESINRWDAYLFDVPCKRTDAITILHRHDLRDPEYRTKKNIRFTREDRRAREIDYLADFSPCPECGEQRLTRSQATDYETGEYTYVQACTNGECHASINRITLYEHRYVPENIDEGYAENPRQLRLELLEALPERRADVIRPHGVELLEEMRPLIERWVQEEI